jgi:hypothetical protein
VGAIDPVARKHGGETVMELSEERAMDNAITDIADNAYIAWSDFVEELLKAQLVTYMTPGWVTYLGEETDRFIAWNDAVVEETIGARTHG